MVIVLINLIKNEYIKLYKRPFIWISLILVVIICFGIALVLFTYNDNKSDMDANWEEQTKAEIKNLEQSLTDKNLQDSYKGEIEINIKTDKVILKYNIKPSDWRRNLGRQLAVLDDENINISDDQTNALRSIIINDDWKTDIKNQNKMYEEDLENNPPVSYKYKEALNTLKISDLRFKYNIKPTLSDSDWKNNALIKLAMNKSSLLENEFFWAEDQYSLSDAEVKNLTDENILLLYKLEHDIPDVQIKSLSSYLEKSTILGTIVMVIMIVLSSMCITNEYTYGTNSQLLIYPYKRWKVLISKCIVLALSTLGILIIIYLSSFLIGILFFHNANIAPFLMVQNGKAIEINYFIYILIKYIFIFIEITMYSSLAILLSLLSKNPGISIGITTILALVSKPILSTLSTTYKIDNLKFVPLSSFDFNQFIDNKILVSGITPPFAIIMTILSFLIIRYFSYSVFKNKEI